MLNEDRFFKELRLKQQEKDFILQAAKLTPTGDNAQYFVLSWEDQTLVVTYDAQLAIHKLNFQNYASLLALGCLLEGVQIAANDMGYNCSVQMNSENPLSKVVISFSENNGAKNDMSGLSKYLSERRADRRNFEKGWSDEITTAIQNAVKGYQASVRFVQHLPKNVEQHFLNCDSAFWKDQDIFFNTTQWVRFSKEGALKTRTGLPAKNLGLNAFTGAILWTASRNKIVQKIMRYTGSVFAGRQIASQQIKSAAGFVFVYAKSPASVDVVNAGRIFFRCWIELVKSGYAAQPFTLGTLMPYLTVNAKPKGLTGFPIDVQVMFQDGAKIMKQELDLPIWGFRFGKISSPLPEAARTLRK